MASYHVTNGGEVSMEVSDLRNIIEGKTVFKRCACCNNRGFVYFDSSTGDTVDPNRQAEEVEQELGINCDRERCDVCFGIGYVVGIIG